LPTLTKPPVAS
jgi:hypothetical protein